MISGADSHAPVPSLGSQPHAHVRGQKQSRTPPTRHGNGPKWRFPSFYRAEAIFAPHAVRVARQSVPMIVGPLYGVKIMLWINASATSGEWPRMVAHSSSDMSLVFLPTRLQVKGFSSSTRRTR